MKLNNLVKNIFPINFSVPSSKILNKINENPKNLLAPLIPHRYNTYIYKEESDYYNMWQNSIFGIAHPPPWGNWWESVKYYEMLMNGCVPLFLNLKNSSVSLSKVSIDLSLDILSFSNSLATFISEICLDTLSIIPSSVFFTNTLLSIKILLLILIIFFL